MKRRANGSGTLFKRNGMYYAKIEVGGKIMKKSLDTRERSEAKKRLDTLAMGFDLGDEERLAALTVRLRPRSGQRDLEEGWKAYRAAPECLSQSVGAALEDRAVWDAFSLWLFGREDEDEKKCIEGHHPEVCCLDDVSSAIAVEFIGSIRSTGSPQRANKFVRILSRIWRFNETPSNPWTRIQKFRVAAVQKRALTPDEVDFLIERAEGELKVLLTIGAYTGMRMMDCARLQWEKIFNGRIMTRTTKTRRLAGMPLHPVLARALEGVVPEADRARRRGPILAEMSSWPKWKVTGVVQRHFVACGLETQQQVEGYKKAVCDVGFHSFRVTFITRLAAAGVPLAVVKDMVGHVSEEMSQRYFRINQDMAARAIAALG